MRQCILIILMTLSFQLLPAQKYVFSGTVYDEKTHEALAQVNVSGSKANVSVVTNEDGFFILKTDVMPADLQISHLGYKTKRVKVSERNNDVMKIMLTPAAIQLKEVVVWTNDPEELMFTAIRKIPDNYSKQPILYNCFYRETAMKRQHHIYIAEGVLDMYKTSYKYNIGRDKVAIRKGRRLLSPKQSDTLGIKVNGGPVLPVFLDVVKNTELLLNAEELSKYNFTMEFPATINDRQQFVVSISPKIPQPYALYYGKFYIDRETLAFTRAELELDMSDQDKATNSMLVRKPSGVRFRPRELSCTIDYKYENGLTSISYIRNTFRFNCDWKRRLFKTAFTACCEMVVTDMERENVQPIRGRVTFDSRDAFYDKVDFFKDPDFWKDYNIIEPSESLDKAIGRLIKKYK